MFGGQPVESIPKGCKALFIACYGTDDRNSQLEGQAFEINFDMLASGLVHQIDTHKYVFGDLHCLQNEIQIALKACGVADDDHGIGLAETDEISCDFFFP